MLRIFAKLGTSEKILIGCHKSEIRMIQDRLNKNFDGSWVPVDGLNHPELLMFDDGMIYQGFDNRDGRYSSAIKELK